ncbi:hypothetical protein [Sphingomonas sp. TZW2008]|uniref:hypothetical protein n=1 Tax=Sphingomonas sp. TZW2008 TaxID=1917973 RepID=UPI000A26E017|nr:hypothetical protein [Sphingomonas sp. TZW2008]
MSARLAAVLLVLALGGCEQSARDTVTRSEAGAALEARAINSGIIPNPAALDPIGAYATETDRMCVVPQLGGYRVGVSVDYGDGQNCIARGTATGRETIGVDLGDDCRFDARYDGVRIVFPAAVPAACARRCTGRTTLTALSAERLSGTVAEARSMIGVDSKRLCD